MKRPLNPAFSSDTINTTKTIIVTIIATTTIANTTVATTTTTVATTTYITVITRPQFTAYYLRIVGPLRP